MKVQNHTTNSSAKNARKRTLHLRLLFALIFLALAIPAGVSCTVQYNRLEDSVELESAISTANSQEYAGPANDRISKSDQQSVCKSKKMLWLLIIPLLAGAAYFTWTMIHQQSSDSRPIPSTTEAYTIPKPKEPEVDVRDHDFERAFYKSYLMLAPHEKLGAEPYMPLYNFENKPVIRCHIDAENDEVLLLSSPNSIQFLDTPSSDLVVEKANSPDARFHLIPNDFFKDQTYWDDLVGGVVVYPHRVQEGDARFPRWINYTESSSGATIVYPRDDAYSIKLIGTRADSVFNRILVYSAKLNAQYSENIDNESPFFIRWFLNDVKLDEWPIRYILASGKPLYSISEVFYLTNVFVCDHNITSTVADPLVV